MIEIQNERYDYMTVHHKKRKVFPVVFYRLGKNRGKLKRKQTKWKLSLENIITSDRDSDTIKKKTKL